MQTTWITPAWLIDIIGISDLDPCGYFGPDGRPYVETARDYIVLPRNGLHEKWHGNIFCNPPYDTNKQWLRKCVEYHEETGNDVIILIFAKTETRYFQETARRCTGLNFLDRRIQFVNVDGKLQGSPTHASVLMAMGDDANQRIRRASGLFLPLPPSNDD
jgi:hypothetical protein